WFHFAVYGGRNCAGRTVRFEIVNLNRAKAVSLMASHQRGPLVWSSHHSAWHGSSGNIDNGGYIVPSSTAHGLTTLCFDYTFSYDNETAFFCSSLPYTLTHLRRFLNGASSSSSEKKAGTSTQEITAVSSGNTNSSKKLTGVAATAISSSCRRNTKIPRFYQHTRKVLVLIARQTPSDTSSSWVMQGFLRFLLGNSNRAQRLRDAFDWVIVPMASVDGVVAGHSRCPGGHDTVSLHRHW
ncbi:unnamed protein product, partial [Amoebophrya sp. A120]